MAETTGQSDKRSWWQRWRNRETRKDRQKKDDERHRQVLLERIEGTGLDTDKKAILQGRWLEEVTRMRKRVREDRVLFYWLRVPVVVGAVTLPAIVNLKVSGSLEPWARWTPFVLSLIVAIAAAVESLLRYGPRWRVYRHSLDSLEGEGWKFFERADPYDKGSPEETFARFGKRVEEIIALYSAAYLDQVASEPDRGNPGGSSN